MSVKMKWNEMKWIYVTVMKRLVYRCVLYISYRFIPIPNGPARARGLAMARRACHRFALWSRWLRRSPRSTERRQIPNVSAKAQEFDLESRSLSGPFFWIFYFGGRIWFGKITVSFATRNDRRNHLSWPSSWSLDHSFSWSPASLKWNIRGQHRTMEGLTP